LIGDYGLFPKVKYWSTSIMGQTINEKALNTTFPIKAELAFWE